MAGGRQPLPSPAEARAAACAARLRSQCEGSVVTSIAPERRPPGTPGAVPRPLQRSDGADIVAKNAARRKKYLFVFPGGVSLPHGGRVGALSGLDTATPTLDVEYGDGRLRLRGTLVFPRNAMLTLKGSTGRGRPVRVADTFETLVVFSEWAWLGAASDNPGDVGRPLPASMGGAPGAPVWRAEAARGGGAAGRGRRASSDAAGARGGASADELVSDGEDGDYRSVDDAELTWPPSSSASLPPRSNPRRAKRASMSLLLDGGDGGDGDGGDGDGGDDDDNRVDRDGVGEGTSRRLPADNCADDGDAVGFGDGSDPGASKAGSDARARGGDEVAVDGRAGRPGRPRRTAAARERQRYVDVDMDGSDGAPSPGDDGDDADDDRGGGDFAID
jgi:hypothetical protein